MASSTIPSELAALRDVVMCRRVRVATRGGDAPAKAGAVPVLGPCRDDAGTFAHVEHLHSSHGDSRRSPTESLADLPRARAAIAYNAGFERVVLAWLAAAFADIASALGSLPAWLVDLGPVAKARWYRLDQRGSWSIKAVLPTIAPELDYAGREVKNDGVAPDGLVEASNPDCASARRDELRRRCGPVANEGYGRWLSSRLDWREEDD